MSYFPYNNNCANLIYFIQLTWHNSFIVMRMQKPESELIYPDLFSNLPKLTGFNEIVCFENNIQICNSPNYGFSHEMPKRKNNDIKKFSINSRRRFMKILSCINLSSYGIPLFITCTYHNILPKDNRDLKRHLDNFIKRCSRFKIPLHFVWRLEFQKRGAPHLHLIAFPEKHLNNYQRGSLKRNIKRAWWDNLSDFSIHSKNYSCKIIDESNGAKLFGYLTKYICKVDDISTKDYTGRRWGTSYGIRLNPICITKMSSEFNTQLRLNIYRFLNKKIKMSEDFRIHLMSGETVEVFLNIEDQKFLIEKTNNDLYWNHNY